MAVMEPSKADLFPLNVDLGSNLLNDSSLYKKMIKAHKLSGIRKRTHGKGKRVSG